MPWRGTRAPRFHPAKLAAGTGLAEPVRIDGGTDAALDRLGIEIDRFRDELQLRMPSPRESRALRLGKGVPVARILRTTYATDGRAVEGPEQVLAGDRYVLCL